MKKNWFEVSQEGLKELQAGKSKDFVLRELIQNAWDEKIVECQVRSFYKHGYVHIEVEDDSPEGFKDISHAFTLFAPTYKREKFEKRGRFNIGEKQVLAICKEAIVSTTKGTIHFAPQGRTHKRKGRKKGSLIYVKLKMNKNEYDEMIASTNLYLPPKGVSFIVNDVVKPYSMPYKEIIASLPTEILSSNRVIRTVRKTKIHIHKNYFKDSYLYEMGLPICKIGCRYNVDVQQKVPMSIDRDRISQSYLQKIFTAILNETYNEIPEKSSSDAWIRDAIGDKNISTEAVKTIVKKRYGDMVVIATPNDRASIDEAISRGYRVIYGSELSSKEWQNIRREEAISSSSSLFPTEFAEDSEVIKPTRNMLRVAMLVKRIAKKCLGIKVVTRFAKWTGCAAQYGSGVLTFNVKELGARFFERPVSKEVLSVILHELAHEEGLHTEASYHRCITNMGGKLIMMALDDPNFFKEISRT